MSGTDNRSDRDLLIRLEAQFENMNKNVNKVDTKLGDLNDRLERVVKELKDELKNDYVAKPEFQRLQDMFHDLKRKVDSDFTPLSRFEPVEEVHKDISKRVRALLVTAGVCVLIAAASVPTWLAVTKEAPTVTAPSAGALVK